MPIHAPIGAAGDRNGSAAIDDVEPTQHISTNGRYRARRGIRAIVPPATSASVMRTRFQTAGARIVDLRWRPPRDFPRPRSADSNTPGQFADGELCNLLVAVRVDDGNGVRTAARDIELLPIGRERHVPRPLADRNLLDDRIRRGVD